MAMTAHERTGEAQRRRANLRLAWILASVSAVFVLGFMARVWYLSH
jgi:hypothetical protein